MTTTAINEKNIFDNGMLISIKAGAFHGKKKLSAEQLQDLPKEIVRGVHDLFTKEFKDLLNKVITLDWNVRHEIRNLSIPFPIDGIYFLPINKIEKAIEMLEGKKKEREGLIQEILDNYLAAKEAFAERYPDYFERARNKYPSISDLKSRFYLNYQFVKITPPDKDSIISGDQYKEEIKKFKETIQEMKKEVVATIYQELTESVGKLQKQSTEGKLNQKTFEGLNELLLRIEEVYSGFVDRKDLMEVVKKVKAQAMGVTSEQLRNSESAKEKFRKGISEVFSEIKALPDIPLKRAIEF